MRYLLIVLGVIGLIIGLGSSVSYPAAAIGPWMFLVGAVFLAVGGATCDIVKAIRNRDSYGRELSAT
jgi:hypothetical protein